MSVQPMEAPAVSERPTLRDLVVRGVAWALVVSCLVLLVAFALVGERPGSYADLRDAVADGRVDDVRIEGGLDDGAIGSAGASVHWRDGLIRRAATVTEVSSQSQARNLDGDGPVVIGSVEDSLVALHPGLRTIRSDYVTRNDFGAWRVPPWVNALGLLTVLGAVGLLVLGPQPRRATRWAWFWLMSMVPPIGFLAFLVLSGLLSARPRADSGRRLTGGWAFLLAMVVAAATSAVVGAVA